jgi:hypothetical protein
MADIAFEITQSLGVLSESAKGWTKELNLVSWNGREPKYDIREWSPDHEAVKHHAAKPLCFSHGTYHRFAIANRVTSPKMGKGVTLSEEEAAALRDLLAEALGDEA